MLRVPYPSTRDSGTPWLGHIPAHWEVKRIKQLARQEYKSFTDGDWIESPFIVQDDGIRLIQTGNIGIGEYKEQGYRYITEETFRKLDCKGFFPGDILICRLAEPVGRACLAPDLGKRMITSVDVCILKPQDKYDSRFIVYYLSSDSYLDWLAVLSRGSTRDRISRTMLGDIHILTPPLPEQQAIATFLDRQTTKIGALIAKKRRLLELLAEQRSAIISHAVTKGLNRAVKMKDSGVAWLGQVPEHWEVDLVKRHFNIELGKMLDSSKQPENGFLKPYLRAANIYWEGTWLDDMNEMKFTKQQLMRYRLQKGDLLVTEGGVTVGRSTIWQGELEEVYYQNSINRARPKGTLPVKFLYYWLYALKLTGFIDNVVSKATFGHLTKDKLELLQMTVPPMHEAELIAEHLDTKLQHIARIEVKINNVIERLREYRSVLISSAVTGKINIFE